MKLPPTPSTNLSCNIRVGPTVVNLLFQKKQQRRAQSADSGLTVKEKFSILVNMVLVLENDCESPPTDDEESVE